MKIRDKVQWYFILLYLVRSTWSLTCPDLVDSTEPCRLSQRCVDGGVCYRDPAAASTVLTGICCNPNICLDTNLKSYAEKDDDDRYTFKAADPKLWTTRHNGSVEYTCPIPFPALFVNFDSVPKEEKYPYNNVSQWRENGDVHIEPCQNNADCAYLNDNDYAGYCFENKKPESDSATAKFCYKLKKLADSEYLLDPMATGPKFCTQHDSCAGGDLLGLKYDAWYCHKNSNFLQSGVCLRTRVCPENEYAARPPAGSGCADETSCNNTGVATPGLNPREQYEPICTQLQVGNSPRLCCQTRLPSCKMGDTVIPRVACQTTADCNKDVIPNEFLFHNKWCGAENTCCESKTDHNIVYCPDEATPLRFEKECEGYTIGQNESGSCPNSVLNPDVVTSGICKLGHCCPGLIKSLGSNLPTHSFATNLLCDSSDKPPTRYIHAYCDKKTKHIVIAGVHGFDGKKFAKTSTACKQNSDCKGDNVCVFGEDATNLCYGVAPEEKDESSPATLVIVIVVIIVVVCICFGVFFLWKWKCKKKPPPSQEVDALMKEYTAEEKVQRANIKDCLTRWYASLTMESLDKIVSSVSDMANTQAEGGENAAAQAPFEPKTQVNIKLPNDNELHNANWVTMPDKNKFIAAEGPKGENGEMMKINRFWYMLYEAGSETLLMFGENYRKDENGIQRAGPYLPEKSTDFGDMSVENLKPESVPTNGIRRRDFKITHKSKNTTRTIKLVQYLPWDEYFAPTETDATLELYEEFKKKTNVIVLCQFGVGPTGVFLALIYIFQKIAQKTDATILQLINKVREMRKNSIASQYQFLFLLQCIYEKAVKDGIIEHMPGMDLVKEKMKKIRQANTVK